MPITNDRFLRACRRESVDCTPVWYLRQAGRYQPEYRAIREKYSLLDICRIPELTTEVTLLAVEQLGVDAAIIFSDIMVPVMGIGVPVYLKENVGPVLDQPLRSEADIAALRSLDPEADVPYVLEATRQLVAALTVPLIGFAGAPFTLASYLVEGGPSREYKHTKALMYSNPRAWHQLMDKLAQLVIAHLRAQVRAGASAVQVFDSWMGALSPDDHREYVLPAMQRIFAETADLGVPRIYFGANTGGLLEQMYSTGAEVIGLDWHIDLDAGWARLPGVAVQGNLDPAALKAPWPELQRRAKAILDRAGGRPGHIFNVGHGITPDVPVDAVVRLTEFVHEYSRRAPV